MQTVSSAGPNRTLTPHLLSQSTGWTYVIKDLDSVSTNYSEAASQWTSQTVECVLMEHDSVSTHQLQRDSGTAVWWLGTQPHYKYLYRLTESAWGERVRERETVMLSEGGRCRMKNKRGRHTETPKLFLSCCWCNDACSHIIASVCLLYLYSYVFVCVCVYGKTEPQYRGDWDEKWQASLIPALYFSLCCLFWSS